MKRDITIGIDWRLPNALFIAATGTAASVALAASGIRMLAVWVLTGVAIAIIGVVTFRSRTLLSWIGHRLTYRHRRPETADLADGVRWDGHRGLAYLEILPAPYESTIIGAPDETTTRAIPVDVIREELVQFDIHCESVTIFTEGFKYHRPTELAVMYHAEIGPVPVLLNGRTYVEVAVALRGSLDSVYARTGKDGIPQGLVRAVSIAAERIRRRLITEGFHANLLSSAQATELAKRLDKQFREALDDERWDSAGPATMRTMAFTPSKNAWTADNYHEWCRVNPHRHLHVVRLDRRRGIDHAEMYLAFQTSDATALSTVGALGLSREYGQQGDILSTAMPSVRTTAPTAIPAKMLADEPFPLPLMAGGAGTFLGYTKTRAMLFVNFSAGSTPFYVISPAAMCQQLLLRLATTGLSIDIEIPGEQWQTFAARIGATYRSNPSADIIVSADHAPLQQASPTQARLVWTTTAPQIRPNYAIVAGADECALYTPGGVTHYLWSTSSANESYMTAAMPRRQSRPAIPAPPPVTTNPTPLRARRPQDVARGPRNGGAPLPTGPRPPLGPSPNGAPRQPLPPIPRTLIPGTQPPPPRQPVPLAPRHHDAARGPSSLGAPLPASRRPLLPPPNGAPHQPVPPIPLTPRPIAAGTPSVSTSLDTAPTPEQPHSQLGKDNRR
jgi:type VII secretion protein EccE